MKTRMFTESSLMKMTITLMVTAVFIFFSGCKHKLEEEGMWGNEYAVAPEGFQINSSLTPSTTSIDFTGASLTFNAILSHRVTWIITITGNASGAVKQIYGLSQIIDNTNAIWDGGSGNGIFFREGETCSATISFLGTDLTQSVPTPITIVKEKPYEGVLISDFEGNGFVNNSQWYFYSDIEATGPDVTSSGVVSDIPTIQGTNYIHMRGIDVQSDWYIGGFGHWYTSFNLYMQLAALSSDPNDIYFNIFVNGNGTSSKTKVGIRFFEPPGSTQDIFFKEVLIDWTGWKQVSVKLSDFALHPDSQTGANGLPDKLEKIEFYPLPSPAGSTCEIDIDYLIFTKNYPFQP